MGLGHFPCGATLCGFDAAVTGTEVRKVPAPALAWDGREKNFVVKDNEFVGVHPVDAKVFFICRTAIGSIRSAPEIGQDVSNIKYIDQKRIRSQVDDKLRTALKVVVDAREISIESIEVDASVRSRVMFAVNYKNLVTGKPEVARSP